MVLHEHQENPHVHLSVRAESMGGRWLNPRKADLHRWRETFAQQLRRYGPDGHPNSPTCGHPKLLHPERGVKAS